MSWLLWRSSLRYLQHHAWQVGLALLGVALGVAVVVAIDVANESARRAFLLATQSIVGRATHQIVGGPNGLSEEVYRRLRLTGKVRALAPVVESDVAATDYPGRIFHLLGVDAFAEAPFRPYLSSADTTPDNDFLAFLTRPATGLIATRTARQLGLDIGDRLSVRVGTRHQAVTLVGLLDPRESRVASAVENLLITDIATAQEILGLVGQLSRIDVLAPEGEAGHTLLATIRQLLPAGVEVLSSRGRSQAIEQMTRAFQLNLTALSLLALIVGAFLIYNTMTFSVVQRRSLLGLLRVQGVTRREIFLLVLGEAVCMGGVGTVAGIGLGILLSHGLVQLVTRTITDLYFVLTVRELALTPVVLGKGMVLGIGASLLAALRPAWEATATSPRVTLQRSSLETRARQTAPRTMFLGLLALAAGLGGLWLSGTNLWLSFGSLFGVLLGCVLMTPLTTVGCIRLLQPLLSAWGGMLGRLCGRSVVATLSRTAVAIAALMVAVSVTVGVGIMVQSFRQTVVRWLESSLHADVYIAPPSLIARRSDSTLDPALVQRLASAPDIERVNTYRGLQVESHLGLTQLVALDLAERSYAAFTFIAGEPQAIWSAFQNGAAVIISEPYAYRHKLSLNDALQLRTDRGEHAFRVVGIFTDYGSDQGIVMMSRYTYDQWWQDTKVSSLGVYAAPNTDVDRLVESLRRLAGAEHDVLIRSNRTLRDASLEIFDRTFTITTVLHLLTTVVAFIGVLSALMALQLERARELGVLRATGYTPGQVWGLMTSQTGLMGLIAGLLAVPVGVGLALILVLVINRRSFGWTLQIEIAPEILVQAIVMAVVAALLAGLYPALRMARTSPALALRNE